jgi:transposase
VPKAAPRKIERYGDRFKATAVKLSSLSGAQIKDVAAVLDIHPFMLSLWRTWFISLGFVLVFGPLIGALIYSAVFALTADVLRRDGTRPAGRRER